MLKSTLITLKSSTMEKLHNQLVIFHKQIPMLLNLRSLHITSNLSKEDKRLAVLSMPKRDEGTQGETVADIDNLASKDDIFPDVNTPNRLFNGVPFNEIPVINVKCSKNNTLMNLTDHEGVVQLSNSCGAEGFRGARRATNVAAQATAISLSAKALEKGYNMVRVKVRGLGPGRMASLKGFQMAGMNIISVTDDTRVVWNPLRPRKARRV